MGHKRIYEENHSVFEAVQGAAPDGGAAEQNQSQDTPLKVLMKAKFILNKHFGNATVVDGSKIRKTLTTPQSTPSCPFRLL